MTRGNPRNGLIFDFIFHRILSKPIYTGYGLDTGAPALVHHIKALKSSLQHSSAYPSHSPLHPNIHLNHDLFALASNRPPLRRWICYFAKSQWSWVRNSFKRQRTQFIQRQQPFPAMPRYSHLLSCKPRDLTMP
jgi:hypothetical protein